MHQTMPLIVTLASGFGLALVLGFIAARIGLPALVGYLLAGVLIGPHTPGFVADVELAKQLAEIGVMLLMFSVGLHFPIGNLLAVKRIALPGAIVQMDERSLHSHRDHSNRRAGCARSTLSGNSRRQKAVPHSAVPLSLDAVRTCHPASGLSRLRCFALPDITAARRGALVSFANLDIVQRRIYDLNNRLNQVDKRDRKARFPPARIRDVESA